MIQAIVAYDVSANDDRARLAAYLSRRGVRLQRSVFQCRIEPDELDELLDAIVSIIDPATDVVHVFRQCSTCRDDSIEFGQAPVDLGVECWII